MSRHKGKRDRPAPEKEAFRERYSRRDRRRDRVGATPLSERPQWTDGITPGRRWAAILSGTLAAAFSFGLIAAAVVQADEGNDSNAVALSIAAALVVPILLLVVSFVSRHPSPLRTAALVSPLVVLLFLAGSLVASEPATGFVLAVGVGGAFALRATEGVHRLSWRLGTAIGLAAYTKVIYLASPAIAIIAAPFIPLAGLGVIDRVLERRHEAASR